MKQIADCVWQIKAKNSGPNFAIVGGTHGDELTGIQVVQKLKHAFEAGIVTLLRGSLFLAIGNPRAVLRGARGSAHGANLNACFSKSILAGEGKSYECMRARELARIFSAVEIGLDIHATTKPSEPFVVTQKTPREKEIKIFTLLNAQYYLSDPAMIFGGGETITLDEYFARNGGIGMCYETGFAKDTSRSSEVYEEVLNALCLYEMIDGIPAHKNSGSSHKSLQISRSIALTSQGFEFAKGVGNANFGHVKQGAVIGHHGSCPVIADEESVIVFPKPKHLWSIGKPICYLAVPALGAW